MIGTLTDVARPSRRLDTPEPAVTTLVGVPPRPASRKTAVGLMAAGVAVAVAAAGLLATHTASSTAPTDTAPPATAIVISGPESVAVHHSGYDPHESSSWHRHSGLHAVAILSGTLTIYGPDCQAVRYGAGQTYIGGLDLHMARNETDEPVTMTETLLFPAGTPLQNFVVPAGPPAGCDVR